MDFFAAILIVCILAPIECALIYVIWRLRRSVIELTTDLDNLIAENRGNMGRLVKALEGNRMGLVGLKDDLDKILQGFNDGQTRMGDVLTKVGQVLEELGYTGGGAATSTPTPVGMKKAQPIAAETAKK